MDFKNNTMKHTKKILAMLVLFLVGCSAFAQSKTPEPAFSNFKKANGLLFVSGQIGTDLSKVAAGTIEQQTRLAMDRVITILKANNLTADDVVSCTVYLTDIKEFDAFNKTYREYFKAPFPTRTCVFVKDLVQQSHIEITVTAAYK
jgi:2-iminobutanoate/2-iminopropanoate deaminase